MSYLVAIVDSIHADIINHILILLLLLTKHIDIRRKNNQSSGVILFGQAEILLYALRFLYSPFEKVLCAYFPLTKLFQFGQVLEYHPQSDLSHLFPIYFIQLSLHR